MAVRFPGRGAYLPPVALPSANTSRSLAPPEDVRLWQAGTREWPADAGDVWSSAQTIYAHLRDNTNQVAAATAFPWADVLGDSTHVLDLGCGSGWLTALLSARGDVRDVVAWDSSFRLLDEVLPAMVELVGGDAGKIRRVCGQFAPLRLADASIDVVVMASAFHHAPDPDGLLSELRRVLVRGGRAVLLNEVPYSIPSMLRHIATTAVAATAQSISARIPLSKRGWVAAGEILYDPDLGDRARTVAQWRRLFARHPFDVRVIRTSLPSYPPQFRAPQRLAHPLTHFVLTAKQ